MAKKTEPGKSQSPKRIDNRRARFDYNILESLEAGMVLLGSEVKSLFQGKGNLTDAYCAVKGGEMWLMNLDIEPYDKASVFQHERRRERKLLMHRNQIELFARKAQEKGLALIPLAVYFKNGRVKVEVGLGRGKTHYDKREQIASKDTRKELERVRSGRF
jgi:SsrA-binding protein